MQIKYYIVEKEGRTKAFPYALGFLAFISIVVYGVLCIGFSNLQKEAFARETLSTPFESISISAKSALVLDMASGKILYEKNPDEPLPLASLTKLMTVLTTIEIASGMQDVSITQGDLETDGDSGLFAGSHWRTKDLIDFSLVISSNDGASALAAAAGAFGSKLPHNSEQDEKLAREKFVYSMNALAQTLGLSSTKFWNEHGLDRDENHVGAYGSARDMATLFQYILKKYPDALEATRYPSLRFSDKNGFTYIAPNTNISVNEIPSLLASKTGYTDLAGGNLIIAFDAGLGRPIIISVLGSTKEERFADVLLLASTTLEYIKLQ